MESSALSVVLNGLSAFFVGALGALIAYALTSRHERRMREEQRGFDRAAMAAALMAELQGMKEALSVRVSTIKRLKENNRNGGTQINIEQMSELYKANLSAIGQLGPKITSSVVRVYKTVELLPRTLAVNREGSMGPIDDFVEVRVSHRNPSLDSIVIGHEECLKLIDDLTAELQAISGVA